MKEHFTGLFLISLISIPVPAVACSQELCTGNGFEARPEFVVMVTHDGKPLEGVTIKVSAFGDGKATEHFFAKTSHDGTAQVVGLRPGNYWLFSDLLGISAGGGCFHVNVHPSMRAKRKLKYDWGDLSPAARQIAGRLTDSQPGQGESPIMNLFHRVDVPIPGAQMKLQDPLTGKVFVSLSDDNGNFAFKSVPEGIYVLHIDSGTVVKNRDYDSADILIRMSGDAKSSSLLLKNSEAWGGSCGGIRMELH